MSIQTQIDRLTSAKAAIKTAIEGKGVTVADSANIDAFAALIDSIEAGGGGGGGSAWGLITPADMKASQLEIEHGLGTVPAVIFIAAANDRNDVYSRSSPLGQSFLYVIRDSVNGRYYGRYLLDSDVRYNQGAIYDHLATGIAYYIAATDQKIIWANRNSSYGFGDKAAPFLWMALKEIAT